MSDLVSIVVPIYNVEKFLTKCVNSIVNQTYKNLEIILVDDGSPDNCPKMCDEWAQKDSRVKVIHKVNQGLGMARNTGIENAKGKYIFFFDSDDYIDTTLVEKCIRAAEGENGVDLVWFSMSDVNENGEVLSTAKDKEIKLYSNNKQVATELLSELMSHDYRMGEPSNFAFSAWSGMFSMNIIREHNLTFPSERQIISEDTYFLLEYFKYLEKVVTLNEILYFHYINTASLTTTYRPDRQKKINYFFEVTAELIENLGYDKEIKTRLCMLYHSFSLAALKMIFTSSLSKREQNKLSKDILQDGILQSSINADVLIREKKTVHLFYKLASLKQFWLCNLILRFKK